MLVLSDWVSIMDSVELTGCVSELVGQQFTEILEGCDLAEMSAKADRSPIGKRLPTAFYIHISALPALDPTLQFYEQRARSHLQRQIAPTLVKFSTSQPKISYLFYPDFESDPHPSLQHSIQVDLITGQVRDRDYRESHNPPVLHRKETFLTPEHSRYEEFAELTRQQDALGLLTNSRDIGTRSGWQQRLQSHRIELHSHYLACPLHAAHTPPKIDRYKAALIRTSLSRRCIIVI